MTKVFSVLCFIVVLVDCHRFDEYDDEDEACTLHDGEPGVCINLYSCKPLLELNRGKVSNPFTTWLLNEAHCGFDGNSPKTCCPIFEDQDYSNNIDLVTKPTTTLKVRKTAQPPKPKTSPLPTKKNGNIKWLTLGETCTTIFNTTGNCSDIYNCEPLLKMVKEARLNPAAGRVVRQAHCGFSGIIPTVCCPLPEHTSPLDTKPVTSKRPEEDFLDSFPEPPICGVSSVVSSRETVVVSSRVAGGVPARLGALPWMALLAYKDESVASGVRWQCGGTLISLRHVLTSAHCIHLREDKLFLVRLGELDLAREDEGALPIDVLIKEMIKHEQYSRNNPVLYDIGVLVLDRDVEFTELVRPICLVPDEKWRLSTFEATMPVVAGWGDTKWMGVTAAHLQVAQLPVLSDEDCEKVYSRHFSDSQMFSKQAMCAGFAEGRVDACAGDSGGPLMLLLPIESSSHYFYEIGVVSFGSRCAVPGVPGVYTRVAAYLPWLEDKVLGRTRPS